MTSQQKFDYAMTVQPYASRKDIPVFPHTCTYAAVPAGVTQADIFKGNDAWMDAYKKSFVSVPVSVTEVKLFD